MNRAFRIVVVEDSETQAFKMRLLLEDQGWEVSVAGAGETALAALGDPLPDLILVDYNLPGMRGDEFCRRIRMNLSTRGIPLLVMTGSAPEAAEIVSLESGADGYIAKSASPQILLTRIRALLRKSTQQARILNAKDSSFRSARILAIDDSSTYLAFLCAELRNLEYEAECATSAAHGLELLAAHNFDCVLVDLVMPEMGGIEVCRRIVATRGTLESVAVIILTASANNEDMNRAFEAGADDYVSKSNDLSVLRARIQALVRRRFYQDENNRIADELKSRELEMLNARAGRQIAEARAAGADQLIQANHELQEANRKLTETQVQLVQNEKMASLGQLVSGIAHEINNPLAFVVNNLFLAEGGLEALAPELEPHLSEPSREKLRKTRARLREMKEGLDRVKALVLDLRTFSRLDENEFKTTDLVETIDAVLLLLNHKMNGRIQVEKHYAPERTLHCYAGRIHQVLMNLLANAVDAIKNEGKIVITTSQTRQSFVISIRDTGSGIPEAIRTRIFDPFFTTKAIGQGTGLGLAISYGIVQDHGGSIDVHSEVGVGTEFVVKIPLDLESPQRHPRALPTPSEGVLG